MTRPMRVVLLAGGGGGAKLAAGLAALVPTIELCVVANTVGGAMGKRGMCLAS